MKNWQHEFRAAIGMPVRFTRRSAYYHDRMEDSWFRVTPSEARQLLAMPDTDERFTNWCQGVCTQRRIGRDLPRAAETAFEIEQAADYRARERRNFTAWQETPDVGRS